RPPKQGNPVWNHHTVGSASLGHRDAFVEPQELLVGFDARRGALLRGGKVRGQDRHVVQETAEPARQPAQRNPNQALEASAVMVVNSREVTASHPTTSFCEQSPQV